MDRQRIVILVDKQSYDCDIRGIPPIKALKRAQISAGCLPWRSVRDAGFGR